MQKVKQLMIVIPERLGVPFGAVKRISKTLEMLFDYEAEEKGNEFQRIGNSLQECSERLDIVFDMIDGAVCRHNGDKSAADEAKRLLLLASTPDREVQAEVLDIYGNETTLFVEVLDTMEAAEIGQRSWWKD